MQTTQSTQFKKAILLIGPARAGKTRLARLLTENKKALMMPGKGFKMNFSGCDIHTEVVIIDDLNIKKGRLEELYLLITEGAKCEQRGKNPFHIHPHIIITAESNCTMADVPEGASFISRFDVFEIKSCI